jgi:hypothetical protein
MTRKLLVIAVVVVLGIGADILAGAEPIGFGAGIGLIGTLLLTFGSKGLAALLKRPGDYYQHEDLPWPQQAEEASDG